jgi:hypothetical protein
MISLTAGICSSTFSNTIIGNLVGRKCIRLCKLTVCSYECCLTKFLWYGFKTSDKMYQTENICPVLTEIIFILLFQHIILYRNLHFNVSLIVHLTITLSNDQLDAQNFYTFITTIYMYPLFNKNQAAWNFLSSELEVTWRTVAIIIWVVFSFPIFVNSWRFSVF